jgi:hypothetical protein
MTWIRRWGRSSKCRRRHRWTSNQAAKSRFSFFCFWARLELSPLTPDHVGFPEPAESGSRASLAQASVPRLASPRLASKERTRTWGTGQRSCITISNQDSVPFYSASVKNPLQSPQRVHGSGAEFVSYRTKSVSICAAWCRPNQSSRCRRGSGSPVQEPRRG